MCRYVFLYSLGSHADAAWSPVSCFLYDLLCITVPQTLHTASNWLTLGGCRDPQVEHPYFWIAISMYWVFKHIAKA